MPLDHLCKFEQLTSYSVSEVLGIAAVGVVEQGTQPGQSFELIAGDKVVEVNPSRLVAGPSELVGPSELAAASFEVTR